MRIDKLYTLYSKHFLVDTDTRNIRKNSIFFALKGNTYNGNTFAEKALHLGATYSIIDEKKYQTHPSIILVDDVLATLQKLANFHRRKLNIPIVGLTGSNGKTTTKELIYRILSKKYKTVATKGNLNNHIGVPLTLLSIDSKTEIGIIEMGANHLKEIDFLCAICEPDFGYITNFGKAHLEGFGNIKGVIKGKSELYNYLYNNNKIAFVNTNDPIQIEKTKKIKSIFFKTKDFSLLQTNPFIKISFKNTDIQSNLVGKYNYSNIIAAITIARYFDVSLKEAKDAIEHYVPTNNRSQIIKTPSNKIILDAYNANPTSMKAALESFALIEENNKIVILGDMFEIGESSLEEHQKIVDFASQLKFKHIFLVGEIFCQTNTKEHQFKDSKSFENYLKNNQITDSFILIKGSRGMQLENNVSFIN